MLQWIALITVAIVGTLTALFADGTWLADVPAYAIALATLAILALIYLITSLSRPPGDGSPWPRRLMLLAIAGASVAAITWIKPEQGGRQDSSEALAVNAAAQRQGPVSVRIRRSTDGRFSTSARINGATIPATLDTGASGILLRQTDAQRAGIDIAGLTYDTPVATANGTIYAAAVRVRNVQVGLISVNDLEALVARPGTLNESLLGMSFLTRLAFHGVAGDFMTLRN